MSSYGNEFLFQDKKPAVKPLTKKVPVWPAGKKVSVHLNTKKTLTDNLEKIKIELKNPNAMKNSVKRKKLGKREYD